MGLLLPSVSLFLGGVKAFTYSGSLGWLWLGPGPPAASAVHSEH